MTCECNTLGPLHCTAHGAPCELCDRVRPLDTDGLCVRCAAFEADVRPVPVEHCWEPVDGLRAALLLQAPALAPGFGGGR